MNACRPPCLNGRHGKQIGDTVTRKSDKSGGRPEWTPHPLNVGNRSADAARFIVSEATRERAEKTQRLRTARLALLEQQDGPSEPKTDHDDDA